MQLISLFILSHLHHTSCYQLSLIAVIAVCLLLFLLHQLVPLHLLLVSLCLFLKLYLLFLFHLCSPSFPSACPLLSFAPHYFNVLVVYCWTSADRSLSVAFSVRHKWKSERENLRWPGFEDFKKQIQENVATIESFVSVILRYMTISLVNVNHQFIQYFPARFVARGYAYVLYAYQ